jgi:L-ascorbate metabolism protein UlaG (beta-lactamase superfamily)
MVWMATRLNVLERRFEGSLAQRLTAAKSSVSVTLYWLGQAGFIMQAGVRRLIIDPYLSDTLAEKYRGTATPHERMERPPVDPAGLGRIDLVLITHHHTDHMDPGTLARLAQLHPDLRFVVPRASRTEGLKRTGAPNDRLIPMGAGEQIEPWPGLSIVALRAAHETLETDPKGNHRFLGYALIFRLEDHDISIIHSGDTIPFAGQGEDYRRMRPDLLLLPVNGRSEALAARGIAGNLTLDEAVALTVESEAPAMIAHHHGLFAFNTLPVADIERKAMEPRLPIRLIPARLGLEVLVSSS